ncbi:mce associated protein mas1a [Rhodococcus sp. IEGM 1366]|uniref:mce associated protein mas1a n=1 Tax=unclassified Rhodococcus (in: high G+C Gram-positive bacteria) TaxID=192944 RepID=UPI001209DC25|nr:MULTISPECIES: mce associated protein mas1a [unclassified Rhodococcus (in: high G+C Gram-positive bacteria)]MDV8068878.1 mce associated protein mas1a [Rhodococcus sp. IEGM 1366]RZL27064.1 MAG: mce associated protein mas1a [Rhodococcus sp. (in: high G+C Gram-positive bacteria)]
MAPAESTLMDKTEQESGDQPDRPSLLRRLKTPRTALTAVLALALVAAVAAWGFQMYSESRNNTLRQEALGTAREYSVIMSSFDYQDLDANKDSIASMSTDEFAGTYRTMVDSLRDVVAGGQGQATATAAHVGIESMDSSSATVLVFVDQEAKNVAAPQGNAQKYRMVISMVRSNDQWLVSNVETK